MGAAGAIVPFFFLHWNETIAGFAAFGLAAVGLVVGSVLGRSRSPQPMSGTQGTTA
jgi:solute:Na+ symporter, SSS family